SDLFSPAFTQGGAAHHHKWHIGSQVGGNLLQDFFAGNFQLEVGGVELVRKHQRCCGIGAAACHSTSSRDLFMDFDIQAWIAQRDMHSELVEGFPHQVAFIGGHPSGGGTSNF